MAQSYSLEISPAQLAPFLDSLLQADTPAAVAAACREACARLLAPRTFALVWGDGDTPRVLDGDPDPPAPPDAAERELLAAGELVLRSNPDAPVTCLAPLRARGRVYGWLALGGPRTDADALAALGLLARQAGPVLALLAAAAEHEARRRQVSILTDIGRRLGELLDLDALIAAIHAAIMQCMPAQNCYISLYDAASGRFSLAFAVFGGQRRHLHQHWRADDGLTAVLLRERAPLYTDDYVAECMRRNITPHSILGNDYVGAWLGLPMVAHDRIVGTIGMSAMERPPSSADLELLSIIAAQAAIAIDNARLYQHTDRQAHQLRMLNDIARTLTSSLDPGHIPALIVEQVCALLNAEEGSLLLVDAATGDLVCAYATGLAGKWLAGMRLPPGAGVAGQVLAIGRSVVASDVQSDVRFGRAPAEVTSATARTLMAAPLCTASGIRGVLEVANRHDGQPFTEDDLKLLEDVADQAAIALDNAQRFAQVDQALARRAQDLERTNALLEHNLRSLTALNALGLAINASLRSPDAIFAMTARGAMELSNALGACVLLADGPRLLLAVEMGVALPAATREDLARRVLASERPELIDGLPLPSKVALAVPLRATQRLLGVLCVCYANDPPGVQDRETVALFATQAAGAVESIALFTAVRSAHDQMASILASIRDGIALVAPDGRIALANNALEQLCGLPREVTGHATIDTLLGLWEQRAAYPPDEWGRLRRGVAAVIAGESWLASGELNGDQSLSWTTLTVRGDGQGPTGALLVLRDISEAKEAERLRQDLANMIVHDLRSPLASIIASLEMLGQSLGDTASVAQQHVLRIARTSAAQMLDMVDTMLDISRLEDGQLLLTMAPAQVVVLVELAISQLEGLAGERGVLMQADIAPDLPSVRVDAELIVRVIQNLLANAIKFSARGSTVLVRAEGGPAVRVQVIDRGIGITPADQERIFAKFSQVGERRGGVGLGLTFCKLAVEAHGGEITVQSAPSQGSVFTFTLPLAAV
jgi:signal transduction histidine kinase